MPSLSSLDAVDLRVLRGRLEEDDHIERAVLDEEQGAVWIITTADVRAGEVRSRVVEILREFGVAPDDVHLEFASTDANPYRRRVRFVGCERKVLKDGRVRIEAALDWQGEKFEGAAEGESGALIELRTAAQAALEAVMKLTKDELKLRLIGVKQLRAFDTELVVASLVRTEGEMQRFVGSVLATSDPPRAACLAVLNGLNRTLGNLLGTES